jgi:hypothetical protein
MNMKLVPQIKAVPKKAGSQPVAVLGGLPSRPATPASPAPLGSAARVDRTAATL